MGKRRATVDTDGLTPAVAAARDGDDDAFRTVYRVVHPGLLRYLRNLVADDAEDVASETWLQITSGLARFAGDGDAFRAWAATIARNRAMDFVRYQRRRPALPTPVETMMERPDGRDTSLDALGALASEQILTLIGTLPPDQAEAVLLRVVMGLDASSAGRVLDKRPGAVRTACHRGLRRLAKLIESPDSPDILDITDKSGKSDTHTPADTPTEV